eukprot:jgi/Ulvmu1/4413/UM002_0138.1
MLVEHALPHDQITYVCSMHTLLSRAGKLKRRPRDVGTFSEVNPTLSLSGEAGYCPSARPSCGTMSNSNRLLSCSVVAACVGLSNGRVVSSLLDCGGAYQPCCNRHKTCAPSLSCVDRPVHGPVCEPCGAPFAIPCPAQPFCEAAGLIPVSSTSYNYTTASRLPFHLIMWCLVYIGHKGSTVACAPCGSEWMPCCPSLSGLCTDDLLCYSEQDRCVVSEYISQQEAFTPAFDSGHDGFDIGSQLSVATRGVAVCGDVGLPPCLLIGAHSNTPAWNCDELLVIDVPSFLCSHPISGAIMDIVDPRCGTASHIPCSETACGPGLSVIQDRGNLTCSNYTLVDHIHVLNGTAPG